MGAIWVWFFMPELKGRGLEEIDELFAAKLPACRSNEFVGSGSGRVIATGKETAIKDEKVEEVERV